jgi:transcriptional regulator with XRE-family HTH domain
MRPQENAEERKETDMTLGERIQTCRKRAGLSQEALAEQLGVSRQAVSKWELDSAQPDLDKVVALARLFGITTDALLLGEEAAPAPEPAPGTAPPPPPAMEKAPPRWYLLGAIPMAVGVYFLGRGLLSLFMLLRILELSRQMLG